MYKPIPFFLILSFRWLLVKDSFIAYIRYVQQLFFNSLQLTVRLQNSAKGLCMVWEGEHHATTSTGVGEWREARKQIGHLQQWVM